VVSKSAQHTAFRITIAIYAAGLVLWLVLGLIPLLAEHVEAARQAFTSAARDDSALGRLAARVLHPDTMADMTSGAQSVVQYVFSALNLGLGLLLVIRRPDDTVPRLLAFALLGTAATFNLPSHRAFHITGNPWPIALAHFAFHIVSGVAYVWAVLLFPDGRLPRQVRLGPRATAACAAVFSALVALVCWRSSFLAHPQFFVVFFGVAVPVCGIGAQALRLRDPRTSMIERRTARMLCAALLPAFAAALVWTSARLVQTLSSGATSEDAARFADHVATWFPLVFAVVPVVLFAAVLRYRLWDLDRWLTRVLVYGLIALLIGIVYVLAVALGGAVAGPGPLWTLVLALSIAATLAEPVRAWARRWANRVVFGVSLSPEEALRTLSDGLAQLTPARELDQLVTVALHATRASTVGLWLVDGQHLVCAASAPSAAASEIDIRSGAPLDAIARTIGAPLCLPVRYNDELLGVLAATGPDGTGLSGRDRALIADIADHAGLVVHNAVLTVGLARRAEQQALLSERLRRSRRRLVEAQDAERRRLERNLHDGAQQALVAALIGIRALDPNSVAGRAQIDSVRGIIDVAVDSLRELTETDHPVVLGEIGLAGALERAAALTRRLGIDVTISADVGDRELDPGAAAAVYFCCVEALQNIVKYAAATHARVEVALDDGELRFAVTDDGAGFEAGQLDAAGGLGRLDERLAAVGGMLSVETRVGAGTRVSGRAPARTPARAS
jgi:signal transduction histidine kinase